MNTHDALWAALNALEKPVTADSAIACAKTVLDGKQLAGFRDWMEKNAEYLLGRLNA